MKKHKLNKPMKNTFILFIAMLVLTACNNQKTTEDKTSTVANEQLVKLYFEHFNKHEWAKMASLYAETADFKDPSLGQGIVKQTRQQIIDKYAELHKTFPDVNDKIIQVYPSGNKNVIVEFISTGTAPDNTKFELPICTVFTIENGQITKDFTYYDNFEEQKE